MTDRPLRILQLVPEPLPSFRADVATLFGKYLPRHGVNCDIVGKAGQGETAGSGFLSARRPQPHRRRWRAELAFACLCLRTVATVPRGQCDVVQVRDMVSIGLMALCIARLRGLRFAYWVSFLISEGRIARARAELARKPSLHYALVFAKGWCERWLLYRVVLRHADHVFVQSDAMLAMLATRGIARERMTAVPMGVDTECLRDPVPAMRLPGWEAKPVIAYLGTLDASRRLDTAIDALAQVRRDYPAAQLLLVGDSPTPSDLDRLRDHAAALGLADAIHITGWLPMQEALPLLAGADVALSYIPRGELFDISSPTKCLEYLALSVPCVGNDSPDQAQVLTDSGAGWLAASNADALARAICSVLSDLPAARQRAAAGPRFIEEFRSYRVLAHGLAQRYRASF